MIPLPILNWAVMAVSLFNTILMLWLGLTIVLNAERPTWGVWLTGGGLLSSGAFFVSHTAIFGYGLNSLNPELNFWWRLGWVPVLISPFVWYLSMLWYSGFWSESALPLKRRQRPWLWLTVIMLVALLGLLIFANPLPSYTQVAELRLSSTPAIGNIPLLVLVYPIFIVLCIVLSLDALRHPAPSERVMGDLARRRAWPWLVASSLVLLVVSLLVGLIMFWIIWQARQREITGVYHSMNRIVTGFDLLIAGLIATSVILVGRAIISYEVFTGRTLPRRGFLRQWRSVVIFAAGYGVIIGWTLTFNLRPIYSLLLTAVLMTLFYALFSWRSYDERERYINQLRPFVASQRLYDHLLTPSTPPPEMDAVTPFRALCGDVLGARVGYLAAVGPLAPLVGPPLAYPANRPALLPVLSELTARFISPQTMYVSLDPRRYGGAIWAIPLWSERGLIGVLLLGEKIEGGLYTQEEMEIARASGERLIDARASAEMARRLMDLQRQRLAESQVVDRRTRRTLHDDILPGLHTAMLTLSSLQTGQGANGAASEAIALLSDVHHQISDLLRDMPTTAAPEVRQLGLIEALRRYVSLESGAAFDEVMWQIEPSVGEDCQGLPSLTAEVIFYAAREAIRNAARYGRGSNPDSSLILTVTITWDDDLKLIIEDNGVGLLPEVQSNGGSGQGLALHSTMMAVIGGALLIESVPGAYTRVVLVLPRGKVTEPARLKRP